MTAWVRQKRSIASATKPLYQAARAASICASRLRPGARRLLQDARIGAGQRLVAEQAARLRHRTARQIDRSRARPLRFEQRPHPLDGGADSRHQRIAAPRERDRGPQHLGQRQRAVVAQQQHPGVERARHHRRQQPRARHQIEPEIAIRRDGRGLRCRALAADHLAPRPARRCRAASARRRPGRSGAARPPAARSPRRPRHRTRCRPSRGSPCRSPRPASGSR